MDLTVAPVIDEPGWQVLTLHDNRPRGAGRQPSGEDEPCCAARKSSPTRSRTRWPGIRGAAQLLGRKLEAKDRRSPR
jgi:two-component system nitrogen regulation sensor histidine kinase GlnL